MKKLNWQTRILSYSAFTGAFLTSHKSADSQVVYVNIEPDTILDLAGEDYYLDMLEDGTDDIHFFNSSFDFFVSSTPWWSYWTRQDLIAHLEHEDIFIAGEKHYVSSFSGYAYYPFALDNNAIINSSLDFYYNENEILAIRTFIHTGTLLFNQEGYWFPEEVDIIDKFLGIKIQDESDKIHYGWIRCDVKDEGRTLIIKDYAYEIEPDHAILAGDTTHYVAINENDNYFDAAIYTFENTIYVNLNSFTENFNLNIYDLAGKMVYSGKIINQFTHINFVEPKGIYIAELISSDNIMTKKIYIN